MEQVNINRYIEETAKTVFSYCLARTGSKEEAEDLSQDILLEILKSACNLRDDNAFYAFMWSVANNVYKNWCKKRSKHTFCEIDENLQDSNEDLESFLIKNNEINLLRCELSLLSEKYRTAAVLYYSHDYSVSKIAQALSISENMVKYLLFKARKILKEGIGMEREFGVKSYNPGKFEYHVVFDGKFNAEYQNLFKRKIPGNILLSAYYTPMTVRELSIEMGISSVYMEDEIALLEKYDLIKAVGECKYQTNIIIFTENYVNEWFKMLDKSYTAKIGEIIGMTKETLTKIRKIGFRGCELPDNNLLWLLYTLTIFNGSWRFGEKYKHEFTKEIYRGATGTVYGSDHTNEEEPYYCLGFAGRGCLENGIDAYTYANFNVLAYDINNNINNIKNIISGSKTKREVAVFPVFEHTGGISNINPLPDDEYGRTINLLMPSINKMVELFETISNDSIKIMNVHAPKSITDQVKPVIYNTLLFKIMGWLGAAALNSGALKKPNSDEIVAVCGYIG